MNEIASAVTDAVIAVEAGYFAWYLHARREVGNLIRRYIAFFLAAAALSALLGAIMHGIYPDTASDGHRRVWRLTMIAIGLTAVAGWGTCAALLGSPRVVRIVVTIAAAAFVLYVLVVLFVSQGFIVAIANYLPAVVSVFVAFALVWARTRARFALHGTLGVLVMFVGAAQVAAKIGIHPGYFDHNSVYHVILVIAFALVFLAGRDSASTTAR